MLKNIFEERYDIATPIAGLTCKPLSILPETISPKEMSLARGGNGKEEEEDPPEPTLPWWNECDPGCIDYCCEPPIIITEGPDVQNGLPPLGSPRGSKIITFSGSETSTPADSSASVDTTTSADSSGTQDQNGGALDNVEEEEDWGEDSVEDEDSSYAYDPDGENDHFVTWIDDFIDALWPF